MGMRQALVDQARKWVNIIKEAMVETGDKAILPMALVFPPHQQETMIVLQWANDAEQAKTLEALRLAIKFQNIRAVILFGTCNALHADQRETQMLFGSIHTPGKLIFTIAALYKLVDGKPVFTEEMDSSYKNISPWHVPPFWEEEENAPKPWIN